MSDHESSRSGAARAAGGGGQPGLGPLFPDGDVTPKGSGVQPLRPGQKQQRVSELLQEGGAENRHVSGGPGAVSPFLPPYLPPGVAAVRRDVHFLFIFTWLPPARPPPGLEHWGSPHPALCHHDVLAFSQALMF